MEKLPDQLQENLRLVFVGTAASTRSAEMGHYYAHPGNRFWRTIHQVGLTPRHYEPCEFAALLELGIGFTDLCKSGAGMDRQALASPIDIPAFWEKIRRYRPKTVAFHQQEGGEPVLWNTNQGDSARPATAVGRLSRNLRARLAIRRGIGLMVGSAMAGAGGLDQTHQAVTEARMSEARSGNDSGAIEHVTSLDGTDLRSFGPLAEFPSAFRGRPPPSHPVTIPPSHNDETRNAANRARSARGHV
jgi:G:T/U-mismatch repair DNA glycosylase